MIGLLQRATRARIEVAGCAVAEIGAGLVVFIGVERGDTEASAEKLAGRLLGYRVFADAQGRMNRSLVDCGGSLLLVPQFTLPADTRKGMRPSFSPAAPPEVGEHLFEHLVSAARSRYPKVEAGRFGAHMLVTLCNDGPVTFWLRT